MGEYAQVSTDMFCYSVDDDEKLREKVTEAMNVYDEYVKSADGGPTENGEGKSEEAGAGPEAETAAA